MSLPSKVNGQRQKPKRTKREFESWLTQVEEDLTRRIDQLDRTTQLLAKSNQTIWENQKECAKSETLLDEQFAVSTRMTIVAVNHILTLMGHGDDCITEKDIEKLFKDWAAFHSRPDYREYMMEWFLGVAIDKLPPPPQQAKEGGSDAESDNRNQDVGEGLPEGGGPSQEADVPEVPKEDSAKTGT